LRKLGALSICSQNAMNSASARLFLQPMIVSELANMSSTRNFSNTPLVSTSTQSRMLDIRRHKMLKHKRKKRWQRDHFERGKRQLQKKMKSEVIFRARMKEITEELNTFDAMTYVKDIIEKAEKEWSLTVAPSGRKKHPHWSQMMSLEEVYGVDASLHIDKRSGFPTPEDKAKIAQLKEEYLEKYSC